MIDNSFLKNKSIVIIIGLSGSGKTYLSNYIEQLGYMVHDDFVQHFYDGELLDDINNGIKVCINDPRLCIPIIFHKYINMFIKFGGIENILLMMYDNEPNKCLSNIENRKNKNRFISSIYEYSKVYDIDIYKSYNIDYMELLVEVY